MAVTRDSLVVSNSVRDNGIYSLDPGRIYKYKTTYDLFGGAQVFEFFVNSYSTDTSLWTFSGYDYLNLNGSLIKVKKPNLNFSATQNDFYINNYGQYNRFAILDGNDDSIWLPDPTSGNTNGQGHYGQASSTGENRNKSLHVDGGGGRDFANLNRSKNSIKTVQANSLGITKVVDVTGFTWFLKDVEILNLLDYSIMLPKGYATGFAPVYRQESNSGDRRSAPIDNNNKIFYFETGAYASSYDFLGGTNVLFQGLTSDVTLQFLSNGWTLLTGGGSATYKNLQYIQFTDTAYKLGNDGTKTEIPFSVDVLSDPNYAGISTLSGVYRFFNPSRGVHLFTNDLNEVNSIKQDLYDLQFEGKVYDPVTGIGSTSLHRLYNPKAGYHLNTASDVEYKNILKHPEWGFIDEGLSFGVSTVKSADASTPIYRFFRVGNGVGTHFFTSNEIERQSVLSHPEWGYQAEGIAWYAK